MCTLYSICSHMQKHKHISDIYKVWENHQQVWTCVNKLFERCQQKLALEDTTKIVSTSISLQQLVSSLPTAVAQTVLKTGSVWKDEKLNINITPFAEEISCGLYVSHLCCWQDTPVLCRGGGGMRCSVRVGATHFHFIPWETYHKKQIGVSGSETWILHPEAADFLILPMAFV